MAPADDIADVLRRPKLMSLHHHRSVRNNAIQESTLSKQKREAARSFPKWIVAFK
jgi:hypothetical protein